MATRPPTRRRLKPDTLLYLVAAFIWITVWRVQDLVPILGKFRIGLILEIALGIAVLSQTRGTRSWRWVRSKLFAAPFLLLALMLVGLPTNLYHSQAIVFLAGDFSASLLIMAALAVSVRERRDLNWLAFAHVVGACLYGLWVIKFAHLDSSGRIAGGIFYDANDIALLFVSAVPLAVYFARPGAALGKRIFALLALGIFTLVIVRSGSRGGFIALIVVTVFITVRFNAIPKRIRIGVLAGGFALLSAFASTTYWGLMSSILHPAEDYNVTSDVGRKAIWKRGVGYMLERPLFGVGAAAFPVAEGTISETSREFAENGRGLKWSTAHNSFVLVGAELGFPGLVLFVAMIGMAFSAAARVRRGPATESVVRADDEAFSQALIGALAGFCVAGFFVSAAYFTWLYVVIGLTVAQIAILRRRIASLRATGAHAAAPPERAISQPPENLRPTWYPAA